MYLTATAISAEGGDDGQVEGETGVNGLITPCQPMSLEATAGKNPVTHISKIYNFMAREIARRLVAALPRIEKAQCLMLSRMGQPIARPALVQLKVKAHDGLPSDHLEASVLEIAAACIADMAANCDDLVAGRIDAFLILLIRINAPQCPIPSVASRRRR